MDTKIFRGNHQLISLTLNQREGKHVTADRMLSIVKKKSLMGKKASRAYGALYSNFEKRHIAQVSIVKQPFTILGTSLVTSGFYLFTFQRKTSYLTHYQKVGRLFWIK